MCSSDALSTSGSCWIEAVRYECNRAFPKSAQPRAFPLQSVLFLVVPRPMPAAKWVLSVSSRDFSASRRTCRPGRKCFKLFQD